MHKAGAWSLFAALTLSAATGHATIVERVAAVVGERAILLSDVRDRARPLLVRIYSEVPTGAQRAAAISQTFKTVLQRMVDEELEQRAANRARIVVSAQEIDDALTRIAGQNNLSVDKLVAEAKRAGLTESQYRNEIKRQVLEAKLLNLRVQGRVRVTEDDARSAYRRLVAEERRKLSFRAAWIRLDLPAKANAAQVAERRRLADELVERVGRGERIADLAKLHSDDPSTRDSGGLLARMRPGRLPRAVDAALQSLEVGQAAPSLRVGNAFYVVQLVEREESELPSFEESRAELAERIYLEKMNKARRIWLDSLRRQTHVEVRM
ncbi:MAG: SurA N-terminal domain-containing protein [Polyangiaceae bacterium]